MDRPTFDRWLADPAARASRAPLVIGVLNVTPDSFSDGGKLGTLDAIVKQARAMAGQGADWLDIGGESTRPGSLPIADDEQVRRVIPAMKAIAEALPSILLSVDTTRAAVAEAALGAGASVVNDVSAGRDDPAMLPLVAKAGAAIILMHMRGTPATMQNDPQYADVVKEVRAFLIERRAIAIEAGIDQSRILLDPGFGFGKTVEHNLRLLRATREFADLGSPLVIGTSRKGFIGKLTGEPLEGGRVFGTVATTCWAAANGASAIRVHDVASNVAAIRATRAIVQGEP